MFLLWSMSYNLYRDMYQFIPLSGQADYNTACISKKLYLYVLQIIQYTELFLE